MSGNLWMFSDMLDDEDIEMQKHDFITLYTKARLDRYSTANALFIYSQYPKATRLKDFGDWAEEKESINKGAKSISVLESVEYTKKLCLHT